MTTPSVIGATELQRVNGNRQASKLRDVVDQSPMREVFRYCLVLTGIKKENLPSPAQTLVLYNFAGSQLGGYTTEEMKHAFELAVAGKLALKDEEVVAYQNFDCGFLSKVLRAYSQYIHKKGYSIKEELVKAEPTKEEQDAIIRKGIQQDIIEPYNKSMSEGVNLIKDPYGVIFRRLEWLGIEVISIAEKIDLFASVKKTITVTTVGDLSDRNEFKKFIDGDKSNKYFRYCQTKCKEIATKDFINNCLINEVNLEKLINEKLSNKK